MYICTYIYIHKYMFTHMNVYICHTTKWPICMLQLSPAKNGCMLYMHVYTWKYENFRILLLPENGCMYILLLPVRACARVGVANNTMTQIRARSPPPSISQYTPPRPTLPAQLRCICTLLNHCNMLSFCASAHCTTLQHTTPHCNTLTFCASALDFSKGLMHCSFESWR